MEKLRFDRDLQSEKTPAALYKTRAQDPSKAYRRVTGLGECFGVVRAGNRRPAIVDPRASIAQLSLKKMD